MIIFEGLERERLKLCSPLGSTFRAVRIWRESNAGKGLLGRRVQDKSNSVFGRQGHDDLTVVSYCQYVFLKVKFPEGSQKPAS